MHAEVIERSKIPYSEPPAKEITENGISELEMVLNRLVTSDELTQFDKEILRTTTQKDFWCLYSQISEPPAEDSMVSYINSFRKVARSDHRPEILSLIDLWRYYLPLALHLIDQREKGAETFIVGIHGQIGTGKTTLANILSNIITPLLEDESIFSFSIDDLYYTTEEKRQRNLTAIGGPGLHDLVLGEEKLRDLKDPEKHTVTIPIFDKRVRDRSNKVQTVKGKPSFVFFEGFGVGLWSKGYDRLSNYLDYLITLDADMKYAKAWRKEASWIDRKDYFHGNYEKFSEFFEEMWNLALGLLQEVAPEVNPVSNLVITLGENHRSEKHDLQLQAVEKRDTIRYIREKISRSPLNEEEKLIYDSWEMALSDTHNAVIDIFFRLLDHNLDPQIVHRMIDILVGIKANPLDPWNATFHIHDMISRLPTYLFGTDLIKYKPICRGYEPRLDIASSDYATLTPFVFDHERTGLAADLREQYEQLRDYQEKLTLLKYRYANYKWIAKQVESSGNNYVRTILPILLARTWQELGIAPDSSAFLYFRDMKTIGSDLDLFYWGPEIEQVNLRLSQLTCLLGLKRDYCTALTITDVIREGRGDFALYYFFSTGNVLEVNQGSSEEFYRQYIIPYAELDKWWKHIHSHLSFLLAVWLNKETYPQFTLNDFKELQYRAVTCLLFGLSRKFNLSFSHNLTFSHNLKNVIRYLEDDYLGYYLEYDEIEVITNVIALSHQCRNLCQVISRRAWSKFDASTLEKMKEVIAHQGVPDLEKEWTRLGRALYDITKKYLGISRSFQTEFAPLRNSPTANRAWQKVAQDYLKLTDERRPMITEGTIYR